MGGDPTENTQRDASLLKHALETGAFQESVEEHAARSFENGVPLEKAIAYLWIADAHTWELIKAETPTPSWHGTATRIQPLVRTHILRLVKGWKNESAIVRYLELNPNLAILLGYERGYDVEQSKLWRAWNKRYSDTLREAIEVAAEILVREARDHGLPAPDEAFRPSEQNTEDPSKRTERALISKNTKEVWQQAKPFIEDSFYLHRGENAEIPEGAWWEQHTYLGMRSDMYAESGADSYRDDTTRSRTPVGRHHRDKLQMLSSDETRKMMQNTTKALIARARHNNELVGKLTVAIDITKGHPWTGDIERKDSGRNAEEYILGYKGGQRHFQWASIQVVGHDIPLVLDVMPVKRGAKRYHLVDQLLETATDLVGGIELVMMDREFDTDTVKDVCDKHDVYYLNPARKHQSERATCTRLRRAGRLVKVEEQTALNGPSRKRCWLPSVRSDSALAEDDLDDESEDTNLRQDLIDGFEDVGGDADELELGEHFESVIGEMSEEEEEQETVGNRGDGQSYALFETNHPLVKVEEGTSEIDRIHMVERMVRRYKHRWGIENGFKKIKKFMVRTSSKEHQYRYFNFAFACVLYNVWRLVDLLVKLAIDGENSSYKPKVDANRFLTHAKKYYGLDPPD